MNKAILLSLTLGVLPAWALQGQGPYFPPQETPFHQAALPPNQGYAVNEPAAAFPASDYRTANIPQRSDELAARMARLEAENQRMQAEIQWMRQNPLGNQPAHTDPGTIPASMQVAVPPVAEAAPDALTMPQVQGEIKRLMWTKGDFRVVPYGWLWANGVWNSQRTNPGSFTLWTLSESTGDEGEFVVDGRNTRLGLDVAGPQIPCLGCASSGGKLEIDFQGQFAGTENKGGVLLRHAYLEVKNEEFRLLAGQTWDVMSPLLPGMLMYSVGWDAGNIGYRRAQFRAERYLAFSEVSLLTLQASINQTIFPETIANARGEWAEWPIVEGRVGWTVGERKGPDALPITFGVSGHIGQDQFDIVGGPQDLQRTTWSCNADLRIPITKRFGFQSEFFTGQNLSAFLGGIGQGVDLVAPYNVIHSTGGWAEFWYDFTPRFHSHFGYGVDDPNNADLNLAADRVYNQFLFTNVVYDLTKQFIVGLEVSSWKTHYLDQLPGDSLRCEFVAKYGF